ncbi:hypothetical protein [Pyrobaculum sp.]|uniref:hypothetical protein n=1 Tax=Pyrobaculum sp. TaxID=2004705 RepID=UPI003D0DD145
MRQAAYEVDLASRDDAVEVLDLPVTMSGVVGYLKSTGAVYLSQIKGVYVEVKGVRAGGAAPDGLALANWGEWKIIVAEVERSGEGSINKMAATLEKMRKAGILSGGSFTPYGVALAAFRVDALRGVTVGSNALGSGPVDDSVLAYPQARSGLVEWARLLDKRHSAAPLLAVYEGEGPEYRVKAVLFERIVDFEDQAVKEAIAKCHAG